MAKYYIRYNALHNQADALQKIGKTLGSLENRIDAVANAMDVRDSGMASLRNQVKTCGKAVLAFSNKTYSASAVMQEITKVYLLNEKKIFQNLDEAVMSMSKLTQTKAAAIAGNAGTAGDIAGGILAWLWASAKKAGYFGAVLSFSEGIFTGIMAPLTGKSFVNTIKTGLTALKALNNLEEDIKNLGKVKRILHPETIKASWMKRLVGWTDVYKGTASEAGSWSTRFYNNFQKVKFDDFKDYAAEGGKAAFAWAGVALNTVLNGIDNYNEMKDDKISAGRAVAETVAETGIDIAKNALIGAAVTAGIAAAVGSAPVLAVAAGTIAISMGLDSATKRITGLNGGKAVGFTEFASDTYLNALETEGDIIKNKFNNAVNCFNNSVGAITATWKFNFGY
ncbi:MAG TPA: hypothetical protein VN381_13285 [Anaerovoracaceae bacterium]|nr:hypothetical protein [Anaerovoracaceae bacterium]